MKEINKTIFKILIGGVLIMSLFACKTASIVNFESEKYDEFKKSESSKLYPDDFYFTRIMTAMWVDIVFTKFSKTNDFSDITVKNITIFDDKGTTLYKKESVSLAPYEGVNTENNCNYKIYSFIIDNAELNPDIITNHKTKYITINYQIENDVYIEVLKRTEMKYIVTRT